MFKSIREAFAAFLQTFTDLASAIDRQTEATTALLETARKIEAATSSTAEAVNYLHKAERHSRVQAGQREDF